MAFDRAELAIIEALPEKAYVAATTTQVERIERDDFVPAGSGSSPARAGLSFKPSRRPRGEHIQMFVDHTKPITDRIERKVKCVSGLIIRQPVRHHVDAIKPRPGLLEQVLDIDQHACAARRQEPRGSFDVGHHRAFRVVASCRPVCDPLAGGGYTRV
jgi:hypothetical protein